MKAAIICAVTIIFTVCIAQAKPIDKINLGYEVSVPWYLDLKVVGEYQLDPSDSDNYQIKLGSSILIPTSERSKFKFSVEHKIKKSGFDNVLGMKLYTKF